MYREWGIITHISYWWESQREITTREDVVVLTGLVWLRIGISGAFFCEFGIEPSGSVKFWEFLRWLHNWLPL
jgi:hypothetical protein